MKLLERLRDVFGRETAREPSFPSAPRGLHAYRIERRSGVRRMQLRVESDGRGILVADASRAIALSRLGAHVAWRILEGERPRKVAETLAGGRRNGAVISAVARVRGALGRLSNGRAHPASDLDAPELATGLMAPLMADVDVADPARLLSVVDALAEAGILHLRFRLGDNPRTDSLLPAVVRAEDLGLIAGVRGERGGLLSARVLGELADAGVDYVVLQHAFAAAIHTDLFGRGDLAASRSLASRARELEVAVVIETPLVGATLWASDEDVAEALGDAVGVEAFPLTSEAGAVEGLVPLPARALPQAAAWIEDLAAEHGVQSTWLPPQSVSDGDDPATVARRGPRTGGFVSVRVDHGGDVRPALGTDETIGRVGRDPWDSIWRADALSYLRAPRPVETCPVCPRLSVCHHGCPADSRSHALRSGDA